MRCDVVIVDSFHTTAKNLADSDDHLLTFLKSL
jgi:hypothetical protein